MKRILSVLIIGFSSMSIAQIQVNTLNLVTNDLVYDSVSNKIYASIPSSNGPNGNSIGVINPSTYILENTIFIGSEPTVLAISDNGEFIYSGFSGSSSVRRFNVSTQTAGIQFSLGNDPTTGSYYVEDIEVMPNQSSTIAISRKNIGFSPGHEGVVIYDNNVMRTITTPDHTGSNRIEFTSENSLIGYNNESTEYGIRRLNVDSNGVSNVDVTQNILSNNQDFIYENNYMYSFDGKVIDITTTPFVIGQFSNTFGPVVYDYNSDRVCFASYDFTGNIIFKRYNPNTFLLYDDLPISQASGIVKNLITCGNGCYAFNTTDNKVIILKETPLSLIKTDEKNSISMYPNPTSDFINIKSDAEIIEIEIFDLNGEKIENIELKEYSINLTSLQSGIYFAQIKDLNGNLITKKFIKN